MAKADSEDKPKKKRKKKKNKEWVLYVKTDFEEKEGIQKLADKYFKGNASALARYCVFNWDFRACPPPKL